MRKRLCNDMATQIEIQVWRIEKIEIYKGEY